AASSRTSCICPTTVRNQTHKLNAADEQLDGPRQAETQLGMRRTQPYMDMATTVQRAVRRHRAMRGPSVRMPNNPIDRRSGVELTAAAAGPRSLATHHVPGDKHALADACIDMHPDHDRVAGVAARYAGCEFSLRTTRGEGTPRGLRLRKCWSSTQ